MRIALATIFMLIHLAAIGQKATKEAIKNRALSTASAVGLVADRIDLAMLVNDLVLDATQLATKVKLCQNKIKLLETVLNNRELNQYYSSTAHLNFVEKVQFISLNIKIYGNAVRGLLRAIERNRIAYDEALAQRIKIDNPLKDAVATAEEEATLATLAALRNNPYTRAAGLGMSADMTPVNRKLEEAQKKLSTVDRINNARANLEEAVTQMNDLNSTMDKHIGEIDMLLLAVRSTLGMNFMFSMNYGTSVLDKQ